MKVKCKNIYNEHTKQLEKSSPWLTIGNSYTVLEIEIYPGKDILYRLVGDNADQSPALYDSRQFEVVSNNTPGNWKIFQLKSGGLNLCPEAWQASGFWEDCYNGDPAVLEIYKREARIIMEEENER